MALGAITEFETCDGILVTEDLPEFEAVIFEQGNEVAIGNGFAHGSRYSRNSLAEAKFGEAI